MINRELTENELFAAAWLFYLDCPLTADDLNGLWQLPRYGAQAAADGRNRCRGD